VIDLDAEAADWLTMQRDRRWVNWLSLAHWEDEGRTIRYYHPCGHTSIEDVPRNLIQGLQRLCKYWGKPVTGGVYMSCARGCNHIHVSPSARRVKLKPGPVWRRK
jgi:hypothetical protein